MKKRAPRKGVPSRHSRPRRPSTTMLFSVSSLKKQRKESRKVKKPSTGVEEMATGPNVPKVVGTKEKESEKGDKGRDKESAAGSLTGSRLRQGSLGSTTYLSEVYTGIGSLVVPCARGEQKAITGDTIVTLTIEKDPPEDDVDIVFVIPKEGADAILGSQKDLTNADHDFIVSEKSARAALKNKKLGKTEENRETVTSPPALRQTSAASRSS